MQRLDAVDRRSDDVAGALRPHPSRPKRGNVGLQPFADQKHDAAAGLEGDAFASGANERAQEKNDK